MPELELTVNRENLEKAWRDMGRLRRAKPNDIRQYRIALHAEKIKPIAIQLARDRNVKMMAVLEKATELLKKMSEEQSTPHGIPWEGGYINHTEYQRFHNAYILADMGKSRILDETELEVYVWTYVIAGLLAGVLPYS
jgi:hypothetical protein